MATAFGVSPPDAKSPADGATLTPNTVAATTKTKTKIKMPESSQLRVLEEFRVANSISMLEHIEVLKHVGLSPQEYQVLLHETDQR